MRSRPLPHRPWLRRNGAKLLSLASLVIVFLRPLAAYSLSPMECSDAHFSAQKARAGGALLLAERELGRCGDASCPGVLREECIDWLGEVQEELPSLVIVVVDPEGQDIVDYALTLNGKAPSPDALGVIRVDPGTYAVDVNAGGFARAQKNVQLRVREQQRRIEFRLDRIEEGTESRGLPRWPAYLFGSFALASGAAGLGLGVVARSREEDLESCLPTCTESEVDPVERRYVAANVALGVAAVSLAGGVVWFLASSPGPSEPRVQVGFDLSRAGLVVSGRL